MVTASLSEAFVHERQPMAATLFERSTCPFVAVVTCLSHQLSTHLCCWRDELQPCPLAPTFDAKASCISSRQIALVVSR